MVNNCIMAKNSKAGAGKQGKGPAGKDMPKKNRVKQYTIDETDAESMMVNEPAVAYVVSPRTEKPLRVTYKSTDRKASIILTGAADKPESHMTPIEKMAIARAGVSKKDLENLKEKTELDYDKLATALAVTRVTLISKKGEEKFNTSLSERIVDLADLYSYGYEVFEDNDRFNTWMFRPNKALGGQPPYALIDNQFGREEVRNIIGRIEYGVYS